MTAFIKRNSIAVLMITVLLACEGDVGPAGINSLVRTLQEPSGPNCSGGGIKIEAGPDNNKNGVLDTDEVQSAQYVCNGVDGLISLVKMTKEPGSASCPSGNVKIDSGIDANNNDVLDNSEIEFTQLICNGGIRELRLLFKHGGNNLVTTSSTLSNRGFDLQKFNLSNYPGVDSVALGGFAHVYDAVATCSFELYDLTNGKVIPNSKASTTSTSAVWVFSTKNFLDQMPVGTVDLGLKLSREGGDPTSQAVLHNPFLILSWKD